VNTPGGSLLSSCRQALSNGLQIVSESWLDDCVKLKKRLDVVFKSHCVCTHLSNSGTTTQAPYAMPTAEELDEEDTKKTKTKKKESPPAKKATRKHRVDDDDDDIDGLPSSSARLDLLGGWRRVAPATQAEPQVERRQRR